MRTYRFWLIGFFLAVIYAVPLTQAAIEIARGGWPQVFDVFRQTPTAANLRSFERDLERASVVASAVRPWMQYVWFGLLHDPGEKAIVGRDGWLFYKPDVRYLVEPGAPPVRAIVRFRDQLAELGIRLLVVPVPGKPSVYPDRLTGRASSEDVPMPSHTRELLNQLRAANVETMDLLDPLAHGHSAGYSYLRRDTHWNGATARRAAELVAARIRSAGWYEGGTADFVTRPVSILRRGDVVRMIDVPRLEHTLPPESVSCDQVLVKGTGALYSDDPAAPVLVLGDSFLRIYENDEPKAAGFIAHLARELRTPLATIVNDGGASTLVRQQLARKPELLAGKKLVVWEFVERDLGTGAEGWQDVPLPNPNQDDFTAETQSTQRQRRAKDM